MKAVPAIVLCTLNAKYIHASLGLRYLLANMGDLKPHTRLCEFTIARAPQDIADELLQLNPAVIGFGVYIWNVTQTCEVVRLLKSSRPDIKLVLGGPEVSHEVDEQSIVRLADFVITGWGDVSFAKLCRALLYGPQPLMKIIAGEQPPLEQIRLPYAEYTDADLAHRLLYVEASRGCPFKCEFCLSSLDKTAWAFDLDLFLTGLETLYRRGARNFKFVDRTFNLKIDASVRILQFFLDKLKGSATHEVASVGAQFPDGPPQGKLAPLGGSAAHEVASVGAQFPDGPPLGKLAPLGGSAAHEVASVGASLFVHFEVIPDHLPEKLKEMIAQFPPGVLQFEVGIQSFNVEVQQRISRRQDNDKTVANLRWLVNASNAHLHTDLIFALPGESLPSFAQGFDRLYAIKPHEIQLGILKRLRGTPIARHTAEHGMVYDAAPPYTVLQTGVVSATDMQRFTRLARYWDLTANSGRFRQSLALLLQGPSAFDHFMRFSDWLWQTTGKTSGLTPENLVDSLFDFLTREQHIDPAQARNVLLADYQASGAKSRPHSLRSLMQRPVHNTRKTSRALVPRQARHEAVNSLLLSQS